MIKKFSKLIILLSIIATNYYCKNNNGLFAKSKTEEIKYDEKENTQISLSETNEGLQLQENETQYYNQINSSNIDQNKKTRCSNKKILYLPCPFAILLTTAVIYGTLASNENFYKSCIEFAPYYSNCNRTNKLDICCKSNFKNLELCKNYDINTSCKDFDNCRNKVDTCRKHQIECYKTDNYYLDQNSSKCQYYNGGLKYCQNQLKKIGLDGKYCIKNQTNASKYLMISGACIAISILIFFILSIYYIKYIKNRD